MLAKLVLSSICIALTTVGAATAQNANAKVVKEARAGNDRYKLYENGDLTVNGVLKWARTKSFSVSISQVDVNGNVDGTLYWLGTGGILEKRALREPTAWVRLAEGVESFEVSDQISIKRLAPTPSDPSRRHGNPGK